MVLQRGYEDQRRLVSKGDESDQNDERDERDESAESERRLASLGAMKSECSRRRLCVWCSWGNCFLLIALGFVQEGDPGDSWSWVP